MARAGPWAASTLSAIACPGPAGSCCKPRFLRSTRLASLSPPTPVSSVFYSSWSLLSSVRETHRLGFFTLVESSSLSSMRSVTLYNSRLIPFKFDSPNIYVVITQLLNTFFYFNIFFFLSTYILSAF